MQQLGLVNGRKIIYTNLRWDAGWFKALTNGNWCTFTITDEEDKDFVEMVVEKSL